MASGRVLTDKRMNLNGMSLDMCVCWKDYLDGLDREKELQIQHAVDSDTDEEIEEWPLGQDLGEASTRNEEMVNSEQ
ncbi:hypothetical protein NAB79_19275 [Proteus mirabilis]|nr:hypothetical protein [Proteus mirabilis]